MERTVDGPGARLRRTGIDATTDENLKLPSVKRMFHTRLIAASRHKGDSITGFVGQIFDEDVATQTRGIECSDALGFKVSGNAFEKRILNKHRLTPAAP